MAIKPSGKFGEFVKQYEKARRPYIPEVFSYLKSFVKVKNPFILDLGCGTGIATRQLVKLGTVIGCDPDPIMLKHASKHKNSGVKKYVVGRADQLPFPDQIFDMVTAFAAFHWFDDKKSAAEIKRVLKPGGIFFAVGSTGTKPWGEGYRKAIIKAIHRPIAQFIKNIKRFKPEQRLKLFGFRNIRTKSWKKSQTYSLENAIEYVQSVSIWETVPKSLRTKALAGLKKYFNNMLKRNGEIERKLTVKVAAGIK